MRELCWGAPTPVDMSKMRTIQTTTTSQYLRKSFKSDYKTRRRELGLHAIW